MEDILKNRHVDSVSVSYVDEGGTPCNENKLYIYDSKQAESFILLFKGDSHGIPAFVTSMCRLMVEVELSSKEKLYFHLYFFGNNSTSSASIDFDPRLPSSKTIELRYGHADLSHKSAQNVYNYLQSTSPSREELELLRIEE